MTTQQTFETYVEDFLSELSDILTKQRNKNHGPPTLNHQCAASLWNVYLSTRRKADQNFQLTEADYNAMMMLAKVARVACNPTHKDSWQDSAGYACIGSFFMEMNDESC
ncbi:MAG: hypothetical protein GF334_06485 [Candidatus Altiarchaeales archaeon]|nr:hypothetical protein [Candidatus Altiarchaeales archaeon]